MGVYRGELVIDVQPDT